MSRGAKAQRIGIREVALAAGVSATTVSHALNGRGRLPESTRRRVREAAERLGYRPSAVAQRLVDGRTGLLGLTIASPGKGSARAIADFGYFVQVLSAASTAALANGYSLVLTAAPSLDSKPPTPALDGAIVVDPIVNDPTLSAMFANGTPTVTTGRVPGGQTTSWIDNDHRAGTTRLLAHLERQGAKTVALISSPLMTTYAKEIKAAYSEWCAQHDQPAQIVIARRDLGEAAGYAAAMRIFDERQPDAIVGGLDRLALGALLAAQASNIKVPRDLLIAAYSDSQLNLHATPSITALQLNPDQIGKRAIEVLIDLVEGRDATQQQVKIPARLIVRGSTVRHEN